MTKLWTLLLLLSLYCALFWAHKSLGSPIPAVPKAPSAFYQESDAWLDVYDAKTGIVSETIHVPRGVADANVYFQMLTDRPKPIAIRLRGNLYMAGRYINWPSGVMVTGSK